MALTPWVHGPSWSSFHAPGHKFGRRGRPHGMFVVVCWGGHRGGDMVSDMVNPGDFFFLKSSVFLISCYHVSRCLDTWIIVDQYGAIWIVALLCLHYPFPVDRLCSMRQWSVFFQSNFRSTWCQLQSVHIKCCPKDMAIATVWFGWVFIFLLLPYSQHVSNKNSFTFCCQHLQTSTWGILYFHVINSD